MSLNNNKTNLKEKLIITLMIVSLFVGVYIAINSYLNIEKNNWINENNERRIIQTQKLATDADRNYFLTRKILPLVRRICEDSSLDIKATRENYLKKYGLDISIYKFDKNQKLIETAPEQASNKWLMRNLFPALVEKDINLINIKSKELDKKIEFAFGYGKNLIALRKNPEIIINTIISGKEIFTAWDYRSENGVIILSNNLPDKDKILQETINSLTPLSNQLYSGRLNSNSKSEEQILAQKANNYLTNNSMEQGVFNNLEWYFIQTKNNDKFYTAYKCSSNVYDRSFFFTKILFSVLIILTIFFIFNSSTKSILSLKIFIILIFIAASILPIIILGTTNLESIDTLKNIHKNELRSSMEEAIGNVTQKIGTYLNYCSSVLVEITEAPKDRIFDNASLKNIEEKVNQFIPNSRFSVRNPASEEIYSNSPKYSSGQETLYKSLANRYIKRYIPERLKEMKYSGNPFADNLVSKDDLGFSAISNYRNQLQFVKVGNYPLFDFIRLYPKKVGKVALINIQPKIQEFLKKYNKTIDKRSLISQNHQINLVAFSPLRFRWTIPPEELSYYYFEQAKAAYVINKPIFRKINHKGRLLYSLCIPNSNYEDICYIGSIYADNLQKEVSKQKLYIIIGAFTALILLLSIITLLMHQLIQPLNNLEVGIKALSEHKYEVKLPVPQGKDELVTLFKEFNFMMGENYDMQMAKNVQDGLVTKKFPEINGYYINGFTKPAGDLGGDCLTSFTLPDGKILFLIGDLTGHSIGSALMMAFVRSVTFNWSQGQEQNPSSLADEIDQMLRDNNMGNMFMGIICGILDPETGNINFITRGHIYPLFIRNNNTVEWLGKPSFPLGIGKKRLSIEQSTTLLPGERILCISDGFIEVHKDSGLTIEYPLVEKWAIETLNCDNANWITNLENKYKNWCKEHNCQQTDDLTLFTIINDNTKGEPTNG